MTNETIGGLTRFSEELLAGQYKYDVNITGGTISNVNIDVDSGAINNTTVGITTPAAGSFTTLSFNTSFTVLTTSVATPVAWQFLDGVNLGTYQFGAAGASFSLGIGTISFSETGMSSPSLAITGNSIPTNGIYLPSANTVGISCNSNLVGTYTATGLNNTIIGATTPLSGTFTVLTANTSISAPYFSPSTTSGIIGTTTNNNAAAGSVGEYVESSIATGSQVSLTDDTTTNITSISLTAGDWDVRAVGYFDGAAGTTLFDGRFSVTTTSATIDSSNGRVVWWPYNGAAFGNGADASLSIPPARFSLSGTTTVYLVARGNFSASTLAAYGIISARRIR